jgi:hypothetical protein
LRITQADPRRRKSRNTIEETDMNVQRTIFASVGIVLLAATAGFAQQVKTDYDRSTDFSQYKTYSWEKVRTQDAIWGEGFANATTTVDNYQVGTLVVDLFDANTKKIIWRGSSCDTLSDKSDKNINALDKGVQKMFDHFPPREKKWRGRMNEA